MKTTTLFLLSTFILTSCSSIQTQTHRFPAGDKSKDIPACLASTKQSGDVDLYWQLAQSQASGKLEDICQLSVMSLKPTQFAVGFMEVKRKSNSINELSAKDQVSYLKKNPEPIVIGPRGEFYIIDHHHLARALYDSNVKDTFGIVLENWNNTNEEKFWEHMKAKNWVYLVDETGTKRTVQDLKNIKSVKDLRDDPYRSLAGQTRCKTESKCVEGQWLKQAVPFIEFLWAEHFRNTPSVSSALKTYGQSNFDKVTQAASEEVRRLRGVLPANEARLK